MTKYFVCIPAMWSIAALSLSAQPNFALMRERTVGLNRVAVSIEVRTSNSAAQAAISEHDVRAALLKEISKEGASFVARGQADAQTLLLTVRISCASEASFCAIAILYSRFATGRTDDNAPELLVWLIGPNDMQARNWTSVATQLRAYSQEGALVAARLVRKPRQ